MSIKSSQKLVQEANENIETLSANEVKSLVEKDEITLIDVRDIRELWKEGTLENSKHIPRGMLEFWLDPNSSYYQENKIKDIRDQRNSEVQKKFEEDNDLIESSKTMSMNQKMKKSIKLTELAESRKNKSA